MHITTLILGGPLLAFGALHMEPGAPSPAAEPTPSLSPAVTADGEAVARRRFDLSAMRLARSQSAITMFPVTVLPLMRRVIESEGLDYEEIDFDLSPDEALVQMFSEHRGDELESMEFISENILELVAPPALIDEFAALVGILEDAMFDSTPIKVVRFEDAGGGPAGLTTMDALEKHLGSSAELRSRRTMQLMPGGLNELHDVMEHDVVAEVDIQIAQGAAISDARAMKLASGMSLWTMGRRNGRGIHLAYALSATEHSESDGNTVTGEFTLSSEQGASRTMRGFEWDESFGLAGGVLAGEAEILPGEALVLAVGELGGGHRECVAICLPKGSNVSVSGTGKSIGPDHTLWIGSLGLASVPSMVIGASEARDANVAERLINEFRPIASVVLRGLESSFVERLETDTDFSYIAEIPGSTLVSIPNASAGKLAECVAGSFGPAAPRLNVSISAAAGDEPLSQVAALAVMAGRAAAVSSGREWLIGTEDDVEVAQFAACHDPLISTHFEGLRASMSLIQLSGGRLAYSLEGNLSIDVEDEELAIYGTAGLSAITSKVLILKETGTVAKDAGGGWTILLGDESGRDLRVELKVSPVK